MAEKVDIDEQLILFIQLQEIDEQIYRLNTEKKAKPEEIKRLRDSLGSRQLSLKEQEANLKNLQLKRKEKEIELETKEASIKKLQVQLYQLKTNKEYTAMIHEIEGQRADKSLLEDDVLRLMDAVDVSEAKIDDEKAELAEETEKVEGKIKEIEQVIKEIEAMLAELKNKRDGLIPGINSRLLKDYERILAGKDGLALVEVTNDACGGCYMQLPPQVINEIKMKEHMVYCENCRRMLYIKDDQA